MIFTFGTIKLLCVPLFKNMTAYIAFMRTTSKTYAVLYENNICIRKIAIFGKSFNP